MTIDEVCQIVLQTRGHTMSEVTSLATMLESFTGHKLHVHVDVNVLCRDLQLIGPFIAQ